MIRRAGFTVALAAGIAALSFAAAQSASMTVAETGSTLIYPLFNACFAAYAKVDPNLHMTAGTIGSEAGITQAIAKQVQIGTSDAYMSDNQGNG